MANIENDRMTDFIIRYKKIFTRGIIESHLAELIFDWESNLPKEINLSYLPSNDCLILRLTEFFLF